MPLEIDAPPDARPTTPPRPRITPQELAAALHGGNEIAVIDVRPDPNADGGHLLRAVTLPIAELPHRVVDLAPRTSVPIAVYGARSGDPAVAVALDALAVLGYDDVRELDGGQAGWRAAGLPTYARELALSKAFGEFVEQTRATPGIDPAELVRRLETGDDLVLVDSRPFGEYHAATVPGAINLPGAELLAHIGDIVTSESTSIVVTCGGRTRAILGAQVLIDSGLPNPVFELENGTTGWLLSGRELEHGATRVAPASTVAARAEGAGRARRLAERAGVREIDIATLDAWRGEAGERTLYVFDVRTPEEFEAGHLDGTRWVAGGQLVQEISRHVAVLAGRVVLVDDTDGGRAFVTAAWLRQLGVAEVAVLAGWPRERTRTVTGVAEGARLDRGNAITADSDIEARRRSSAAYVAWCAAVVGQVEGDPSHAYLGLPS